MVDPALALEIHRVEDLPSISRACRAPVRSRKRSASVRLAMVDVRDDREVHGRALIQQEIIAFAVARFVGFLPRLHSLFDRANQRLSAVRVGTKTLRVRRTV